MTSVEKVSPSTDACTAHTTELYVTVTCDDLSNWKIQGAFLQTKAMPEWLTAENMVVTLMLAMWC